MQARPLILALCVACLSVRAAEKVAPVVNDALVPLPAGAVQLDGPLGAAIRKAEREQLARQPVEAIVEPFRVRRDTHEWRSEFWGKWMTGAVAGWNDAHDPLLRERIGEGVAKLIATQTSDGYIGAYPDGGHLNRWDVWGRKYTLLGLLAWHDASGDPEALRAACREADFLLSEVGPGRQRPFKNDMWSGMASSSVLEPMVLLYRRTGDARYLDFAKYLVSEWPAADGPDLLNKALRGTPVFEMFPGPKPVVKAYGDAGKSKAYEMMSCFEGLTELYRVTGVPAYREAVQKVYASIRDREITIIGSGSDWERWSDGTRRQTETWQKGMETCVTVTWMKLSAQVLRLTSDPRCADEIERSAWNALLGAQAVDGTWWCHHTPLAGVKERAPEQCGMPQNCCVANGPRGLLLLPSVAVMGGAAGPVVNLYLPLRATAPLAKGGSVMLEQVTTYPDAGTVRVMVTPDQAREFVLSLRIPAWSERTTVRVNGQPVDGAVAGQYLRLGRRWKAGDVVELGFDLRARAVPAPGNPAFVAILRGPIVLARDERIAPHAVDAPLHAATLADASVPVTPVVDASVPHVRKVYRVGDEQGLFCDFASAGNTWTEASRYRVWLPRAE